MPELPEVQTVVNFLKLKVINENIKHIDVYKLKLIKEIDVELFQKNIINQNIRDVWRKGKYIIFNLSNGLSIISHLRMEGKFNVYQQDKWNKNKHDYIVFYLSNNKLLIYNDSRQFGTFHLSKTSEINQLNCIAKLAPDPLSNEFNELNFQNKIKKSNKNIKTLLLDQTIISGIGNIYANEILYSSSINPFLKGKNLNEEQLKQIVINAKSILEKAIKYNGTTIHSFSFGNNESGNYSQFLNVHFKENQNCKKCKDKILREKINGRSAYFCPKCQKN